MIAKQEQISHKLVFKMFALKFAFLLASVLFCAFLLAASAPAKNGSRKVVYRRYQRRRPSAFPNDFYVDEYLEVFNTKQKPPMNRLSDADVDRIIRCDFDPTRKECEDLHKPMLPDVPLTTPKTVVTKPSTTSSTTTTTKATTTTTTTPAPVYSTTSLPSTLPQTTTIKSIQPDLPFLPEIRTTTTTTTTTTERPLLPVVPPLSNEVAEENAVVGDVEEVTDNDDEYDEDADDDDYGYDDNNENDKYSNNERDTELDQDEDYADEEEAEDTLLK